MLMQIHLFCMFFSFVSLDEEYGQLSPQQSDFIPNSVVPIQTYQHNLHNNTDKPIQHIKPSAHRLDLLYAFTNLIIQSYVILIDTRTTSNIQIVALVMTCLSTCIDLLHHFKYIQLTTEIYFGMLIKAIFTTASRTVLVALLLNQIGVMLWLWIFV